MENSDSYEDALIESLRDPAYAAEYLNAHLSKDEGDTDEDAEQLFLIALRNVARARGVSAIADRTDLGRESLYKALSAGGNPTLSTLRAVLDAMGLQLTIQPTAQRDAASGKRGSHRPDEGETRESEGVREVPRGLEGSPGVTEFR